MIRRASTTSLGITPLVVSLLAALSACANTGVRADAEADAATKRTRGVWSATFDNDSYSFNDGNYTNGIRIGWFSPEIHSLAPTSVSRRVARASGWLPGIDPNGETYVGFAAGQLIFTPENLLVRDPPLDDRPYAGILYFDTSVMTRDEDRLTAWFLRVGVVGEPSLAEQTQMELHRWFGADPPRGWDHQLRDEPLLNIGVERHVRAASGTLGDGFEYDVTPNWGAALGNYFTGLNAGVQLRVGRDLPEDMGNVKMRTSFEGRAIIEGVQTRTYAFLGLDTYAVAHYLPIDGNVLVDEGRGVDSRDGVAAGRIGFTTSRGNAAITLAYTLLTDTYDTQGQTGQYGTISLAWFR